MTVATQSQITQYYHIITAITHLHDTVTTSHHQYHQQAKVYGPAHDGHDGSNEDEMTVMGPGDLEEGLGQGQGLLTAST